MYKANSDANLQVPGRWDLDCIIRNSEGRAIASATRGRNGFDCAATAEAYAIYAAMHLALDCGIRNVVFESDCEAIINKLNRRMDNERSYLGSILKEIWRTSEGLDRCVFQLIFAIHPAHFARTLQPCQNCPCEC